jgi:hypothetical protein
MARSKSIGWDLKTLEKLKQEGKIRDFQIVGVKVLPKKSKFGNKKTTVGEISFDSEREAKRYKELLLLLKAGEIGLLELQVPFELNTGGTHSLKYVADFVYVISKTGEKVVEDSKGFKTVVYRKKCKLMKKIYNIKIKET